MKNENITAQNLRDYGILKGEVYKEDRKGIYFEECTDPRFLARNQEIIDELRKFDGQFERLTQGRWHLSLDYQLADGLLVDLWIEHPRAHPDRPWSTTSDSFMLRFCHPNGGFDADNRAPTACHKTLTWVCFFSIEQF